MTEDLRYELKFIANETDYNLFLDWKYNTTNVVQSYAPRKIHSIYFDDAEFQAVKDNLSGVADRVKYRLRWYEYDNGTIDSPVFELKYRQGRLGYKKKLEIPELKESISMLPVTKIMGSLRREIGDSDFGSVFLNQYLHPSLYLSYEREYYENPEHIRLTLDQGIAYFYINPDKKIGQLSCVRSPNRIIEVKFLPETKNQVANWLNSLHLVPKRHSKYLSGLASLNQVQYL